jgi:class 3 adenylate cyclase/CHASE2 domain-containing sensor protein
LALLVGAIADQVGRQRADGLSVDLLQALSALLPAAPTASDRTIIVAIDEDTYRQPPFAGTPAVAWTPQVARVLNALLDGGVKVIGVDTIFNQSLTDVGNLVPDQPGAVDVLAQYDRDFLKALARGGRNGRIVMSYAKQGSQNIEPTRFQQAAVGRAANLRPTNMLADPDGVIRRGLLQMPVTGNSTDQRLVTTLPVELFARAGNHAISFAADQRLQIDGQPLNDMPSDSILLNFQPTDQDPPIYSFADLFACAQTGNSDYFQRHFNGKTVILGTVLDFEDRHLTSKRFVMIPPAPNYATPCLRQAEPSLTGLSTRASMPGAYILATIVDNLKQRSWLHAAPPLPRLLSLFMLAGLICLLVGHGRFIIAATGSILLALAWLGLCIGLFQNHLVLPLVAGLISITLSLTLSLVYRIVLVDRVRRLLRRSFSLYLPSAELDRLASQDKAPVLGGELRPVTILFSDIAGYSSLSEEMAPGDLVTDLNRYFGRMTEIVQQHGGFVDKFIGDGILAVFGAPLADPDHALSGVIASLKMIAACEDDLGMTISGKRFGIRVGIHSGDAVVGNIGAPSRFNYTVVGDSVNLASRLEGVGKRYHATIIVSEQTRQLVSDRVAFRELDLVRVVGRDQPVRLFTPLSTEAALAHDERRWRAALLAWRRGDFVQAAEICLALSAAGDEIAATFAARAQQLATSPPATWDGIINLSEK